MPQHKFEDRSGMVLVKKGDYVLGIEKAKLGIAKSSGNEQIEIQARVLTKSGDGPLIYWYGGFAEKQQWGIDVFLKALRLQPKKGEVLDITDDWLAKNVVGALAWGTIDTEVYQAREKNVLVRWITDHKDDPYKLWGPKDEAAEPSDNSGTAW